MRLPVHFRDDDPNHGHRGELCDFSGTGDMDQGCPRGCNGAKEHYANDGHPECDEDGSVTLHEPPPAATGVVEGMIHQEQEWYKSLGQDRLGSDTAAGAAHLFYGGPDDGEMGPDANLVRRDQDDNDRD